MVDMDIRPLLCSRNYPYLVSSNAGEANDLAPLRDVVDRALQDKLPLRKGCLGLGMCDYRKEVCDAGLEECEDAIKPCNCPNIPVTVQDMDEVAQCEHPSG